MRSTGENYFSIRDPKVFHVKIPIISMDNDWFQIMYCGPPAHAPCSVGMKVWVKMKPKGPNPTSPFGSFGVQPLTLKSHRTRLPKDSGFLVVEIEQMLRRPMQANSDSSKINEVAARAAAKTALQGTDAVISARSLCVGCRTQGLLAATGGDGEFAWLWLWPALLSPRSARLCMFERQP